MGGKLRPAYATIEQILADLTHYEDLDTALVIISRSDGGASIGGMSLWDDTWVSAKTIKEALIKFGCEVSKGRFFEEEYHDLDWATERDERWLLEKLEG